jgi:N-methylhydantoinase B/oxoprolinase/acetone carboxylase alpha subunit
LQKLFYPVLVDFHRLREGSGGAEKFRGGLGIEISVRMLCDVYANINAERTL